MRTLLYVFGLLTLTGTLASAQEVRPWAEKLFDGKTTHNFGNVPHGAQLSFRFPFTNIYQVPLNVAVTRLGCGCVSATVSTPLVKSRESGFVEVNVNARIYTGPRAPKVWITFSGEQYYSTAELQVSANSRPDVVFNPGEVNFGVVTQSQAPSTTLEVAYAGELNWRVTDVVANGLPVEVRLSEPLPNQPPKQVTYRLTVALRSDAPAGPLKGEILLKTSDPASPLLPVLVEATIQPSLTVTPITLRASLKVNEEEAMTVVVRGDKDFRILDVKGIGDGISLSKPVPDAAKKIHPLELKIQKNVAGDFQRKLQIQTDFQPNPVTVTVEGSVKP